MYDAIVVGARCAGAPVAMRLARAGHDVLLLDRASFPSDTLSTHFVQVPGMVRLREWGLLERVMATSCPPIRTGLLTIDGESAEADFSVPDSIPGLAAPRRTVLDKLLVDAATDAGAEVRENAMVDGLVFDGDQVVGVQGHSDAGAFEDRARVVVGADGRNSMVARAVGAETRRYNEPLGGGFYSYWGDVDCPKAELYSYTDGITFAFPTNDGLTTIAMVFPRERFESMRGPDAEDHVTAWLDGLGDLGARVRRGRRAHQLVPVARVFNALRQPWGPGWALVGDAVYVKDPTPADGITDAFRSADYLADALLDLLSDHASEKDAMERYRERVDGAALPLLEKTIEMADFEKSSLERATTFLEIQEMHLDEVAALGHPVA